MVQGDLSARQGADEVYTPALQPQDKLERARHRGWIEFGSSILADIWVIETTADEALFVDKLATLNEKFARVEAQLCDGPYFSGVKFSIVDAVFAPIFRYFDVFEEIAAIETLAPFPKLTAWRSALAARASVQNAVARNYPALLRAFVMNKQGCLAARAARRHSAAQAV